MRRVLAALSVAACLAVAAPATASASMPGEWSAFSGRPAADPANGTITLGSTTMPVGAVRLQFGALNQSGAYSLVQPTAGGLSGDPITVPGGLLGLMCPSDIPVISDTCEAVEGSTLNTVTAT